MGGKTDYLENKILDHVLRNTAYTSPTTVYVGLCTSTPTDSAAGTDGIICSYQNPAATATLTGRRIAIYGVKIESYVQTALTTGGYNAQFILAFGHTAVSLATTETATTKAPRRIPLGVQSVAAGAAALTQLATVSARFDGGPVIVNPGEFIAVAKKKVGTVPGAGVIAHMITFDFSYLL